MRIDLASEAHPGERAGPNLPVRAVESQLELAGPRLPGLDGQRPLQPASRVDVYRHLLARLLRQHDLLGRPHSGR